MDMVVDSALKRVFITLCIAGKVALDLCCI